MIFARDVLQFPLVSVVLFSGRLPVKARVLGCSSLDGETKRNTGDGARREKITAHRKLM